MTKCSLLVFALCVAAAAALSSAEANVHPNEGFGTPVYGKKHINETQHFHHEGGKAPSTIKYDVEHHDDVVHFRLPEYGVRHASCSEEKMVVKFATHDGMVEFQKLLDTDNNKILAGGCLDMDTLDVVGVCSRVVSVNARKDLSGGSRTIVLKVRPADWEEVFVHAKVTAKFQPGFAEEYRRFSGNSRRLIGGWGIGDQNEKDCTENDPDCNPEFGKTWNVRGFSKSYNGKELAQWGPVDVTCQQCEFDFAPALTFGLHVKFLKLKHVKLTAEGDLTATMKFKATASGSASKSDTKVIHIFKAMPIVFSIGVLPIKLQFNAPVTAGYSAQFQGKATATAGLNGRIHVVAGVEYVNKAFKRIGKFTPTFTAISPTVNAAATVKAEVFLGAKIVMDINNVARGYIGVKNAVAFDGSASASAFWKRSRARRASGTLKGRLTGIVTAIIGGELGVRIKNKNIGPRKSLFEKEVLNTGRTLWSGTISKSTSRSFDAMEDDDDDLVMTERFFDKVQPITKYVDDASGLAKSVPESDRMDEGWQNDVDRDFY